MQLPDPDSTSFLSGEDGHLRHEQWDTVQMLDDEVQHVEPVDLSGCTTQDEAHDLMAAALLAHYRRLTPDEQAARARLARHGERFAQGVGRGIRRLLGSA